MSHLNRAEGMRRLSVMLLLFPCVVNAASFDCGKATAPVEKLICSDPKLSKLDEALAGAYAAKREALAGEDDARGLVREQRAWLARRNNDCGILAKGGVARSESGQESACLIDMYERRIVELSGAEEGEASNATAAARRPSVPAATASAHDPHDVPWKDVPHQERGALPEKVKEPLVREFVMSRNFVIRHEKKISQDDINKYEKIGDIIKCEGCDTSGGAVQFLADTWHVSEHDKTNYCKELLAKIRTGNFSTIEPDYYATIDDLLRRRPKDRCDPLLYAVKAYDPELPPPGITSISRLHLRLYPFGPSRTLVCGDAYCDMEDYRNGSCAKPQWLNRPGCYVVNSQTCRPEYGAATRRISLIEPGSRDAIHLVASVEGRRVVITTSDTRPEWARLTVIPSEWSGKDELCTAEAVQ